MWHESKLLMEDRCGQRDGPPQAQEPGVPHVGTEGELLVHVQA